MSSRSPKDRRAWTRSAAVVAVFGLFLIPAHAADSKGERLDRFMQAYANTGRFQGAVLVADKGEVILQKGYGLANLEWNIANTPETKFRVGSLTKQFTALLILQLAAEGRVKLDGRLSNYLPEFPHTSGDRITLHHLLSHQSGIPNFTKPEFVRYSREPATPPELAKVFWAKPLDFEPGAKCAYSNPGYHMLGLVIEAVTGKSYEQALRERIFEPLGMRDSGYDHTEAILPCRAAGYVKTPGGLRNAPYLEMANPYAAGGMYSTVGDLRKWDAALYGDQLLSPEYRDLLFQPAAKMGGDRAYGYGWMLSTWILPGSQRQVRVAEHFGGINGFTSIIARLPEDRHLIVLLANLVGSDWSGAPRGLAQILYGEEPEIPVK